MSGKDEFKRAQGKCNCPGPGWGGFRCPHCHLATKEKRVIRRHARRILKQALPIAAWQEIKDNWLNEEIWAE